MLPSNLSENSVVVVRNTDFASLNTRVFLVGSLQVQRYQAVSRCNARCWGDSRVFHRLKHLCGKNGALVVVDVELVVLSARADFRWKPIFVIDKINLQLGPWDRNDMTQETFVVATAMLNKGVLLRATGSCAR
jgi:hypothetical protein